MHKGRALGRMRGRRSRVWNGPRHACGPTLAETTALHATVSALAVSSDAQWLVVGDVSSRLVVYNLDALQYHGTLPRTTAHFTAIAFHPSSAALVVTCATNQFYIYNVEDLRLSDWTRYATRHVCRVGRSCAR